MLVVAQYDNVFRTLVNDCPKLLIPFINEVFQEHYSEETPIRFYPNEHFANQKDGRMNKRITDTCFEILDTVPKKYHLECQSTSDSSMLIRMFEYGAQIALDYEIAVVKLNSYSLEELALAGEIDEYIKRTLMEMSGKILEYLARNHKKVQKGVKSVMVGKVLDYEAKRILNRGISQGFSEGVSQGLSQGKFDAYRELLRDGLITPEEASKRLQISRKEAEKLMK